MMPLFAINPSDIAHITKRNPEQFDDVALHERVRKLESIHRTREFIIELNLRDVMNLKARSQLAEWNGEIIQPVGLDAD